MLALATASRSSSIPTNDDNSSNHVAIGENGHVDNGSSMSDPNPTNLNGNGSCGFPTGGTPNQNNYLPPGYMANGDLGQVLISYDGSNLSASAWDMTGTFMLLIGLGLVGTVLLSRRARRQA